VVESLRKFIGKEIAYGSLFTFMDLHIVSALNATTSWMLSPR